MNGHTHNELSVFFTDQQTAHNVPAGITLISSVFQEEIEKRLLKKGIYIRWNPAEYGAELLINVVSIDQGNRLLRYLFPFIAPAVMEVICTFNLRNNTPQQVKYVKRAQMGVFGGDGVTLLKSCAKRIAASIVKDLTNIMTHR